MNKNSKNNKNKMCKKYLNKWECSIKERSNNSKRNN